MNPFPGDGVIQLMSTCPEFTTKMYPYSEQDIVSKWFNYVDTSPGFSDHNTQYAMQFYQANGQPLPLMFQIFNPPQMLPTKQIFVQVL